MSRRRLGTTGERGKRVRYFLEDTRGAKRYVVQWGPRAARQQESWPATKAGRAESQAFFDGFSEEVRRPADSGQPVTNRQLWKAYAGDQTHLRANSLRLATEAWRHWETFASPSAIAEETTLQQVRDFRRALDARGYATATVKQIIRGVRGVFNWGEQNELLGVNKWHLFVHRIAKEQRTKPRAEYRADEFLRLWAALDPRNRWQWRAWVAVGLLGIYGNRQHEILNLQWRWIGPDYIDIDPTFVKTGAERRLKLYPQTRRVLAVARSWAAEEGYRGTHVLPPAPTKRGANTSKLEHYSIQSLTDAIHRAEARAGVETIRWRAGHGFRGGLMGDLVDDTGDVTLALHAIGDTDLRMAQHYRKRRDDAVHAAVERRVNRLIPTGEPE